MAHPHVDQPKPVRPVSPQLGAYAESNARRVRPAGSDAICFTSGPQGAAFGAGVIHAWLASDREPPLVAAGISTGAITASAMQQSYRELENAEAGNLEGKRWEWFRRYLDAVTNDPLAFIWKAIPNPVDFFADNAPVEDLSAQKLPVDLSAEERQSRRHFYLLTRFGVWLAGLPVRVGTVASFLVYKVRKTEGYGNWVKNPLAFRWNKILIIAGVWWHVLRSPTFINEKPFGKRWVRPVFGWPVWIASMSLFLVIAFAAVLYWPLQLPWGRILLYPLILVVGVLAGVLLYLWWKAPEDPNRKWSWKAIKNEILRHCFKALDIEKGLLSPFELRRRLATLFGTQKLDSLLNENSGVRMHLLLVCAALQQSRQVWPKDRDACIAQKPSNDGISLLEALSAACAIPGLFPPVRLNREQLDNYSTKEPLPEMADLVDGASVRANPIPAFFDWCNCTVAGKDTAIKLELKDDPPKLHVVYNVPLGWNGSLADAEPLSSFDIVESVEVSLELQKQRDTRQEVRQTNFLSGLEELRQNGGGTEDNRVAFKIFADEIAPQKGIGFRNEWEPSREESLEVAARGCQAALETLYRDQIQKAPCGGSKIKCADLLRTIAPRRRAFIQDSPGIPEICGKCSGDLEFHPLTDDGGPPRGAIRSYGEKGRINRKELPGGFEHLHGVREEQKGNPRIVFLGSGGVFRGAFHIGVIGAMQAAQVFPDLVLGASVGALMGGALANISVAPAAAETGLLEHLASVFLEVDKRVALTRTLKNAVKQLGIRGRNLQLAPSELRRMVLRGSQSDAGYAATGAPPALIDAISGLFVIPYRRTTQIASEFVAGHFTKATSCFFKEVRRETLSSFDIEHFVIGTSLIEAEARALLGGTAAHAQLDKVQPYHRPTPGKSPVSFFCTTSFINARAALVLGMDFLTEDPTWDFVFATLSSSAFPAVFAPRRESDTLPGRGRTDRLFADGGMFDNLPFFPALEVLLAGQLSGDREPGKLQARLRRRSASRDIFIAAGLEATPEPVATYDTLFKVWKRSKSLSVESKVSSFTHSAGKVAKMLEQIKDQNCAILPEEEFNCLDGTVNAAVLTITPTDKDHINSTFAFCKSTGMKVATVRKSIADGCYRTLSQFVETNLTDPTTEEAFRRTKVPQIKLAGEAGNDPKECPYFYLGDARLACPFAAEKDPSVVAIQDVCAGDKAHRKENNDLIRRQPRLLKTKT